MVILFPFILVPTCNDIPCVHGECMPDGTCLCDRGWSGFICDQGEFNDIGCFLIKIGWEEGCSDIMCTW